MSVIFFGTYKSLRVRIWTLDPLGETRSCKLVSVRVLVSSYVCYMDHRSRSEGHDVRNVILSQQMTKAMVSAMSDNQA